MKEEAKDKTCLALDLGGTKLLIGEVDEKGRILQSKRYSSKFQDQNQAVNRITECLDDYIVSVGWINEKPEVMGIGMVGQVDNDNGVWIMIDPSNQKPVSIVRIMQERYGISCSIENDVKAATLAEKQFGAGLESDDFIYKCWNGHCCRICMWWKAHSGMGE
jgi:predicted NBD/HSP70 family sugar kinase